MVNVRMTMTTTRATTVTAGAMGDGAADTAAVAAGGSAAGAAAVGGTAAGSAVAGAAAGTGTAGAVAAGRGAAGAAARGVAARMAELAAGRVPFVHATVVRAQVPSSARPGDEAIVTGDGVIEGFVGGVCAEGTVRTAALGALRGGGPLLLRVLPEGAAEFPESPGAKVVVNPCLSGGALEIFLEPRVPPPLIGIVGETPVAEALAAIAEILGYATARALPGAFAEPDALAGVDAVIVASHGRDETAPLRAALDAGVGYTALVASARRGRAVLDGLGLSAPERARISTPAGLDIGARTPPEVALSILAEVVAALRGKGPGPGTAARGKGARDPEASAGPGIPAGAGMSAGAGIPAGAEAAPGAEAGAEAEAPPEGTAAPAAAPEGATGTAAAPGDTVAPAAPPEGTAAPIAVPGGVTAPVTSPKGTAAPAAPPGGTTAPITVSDPVCGMAVTVMPETPRLSVGGGDVWFCAPGCRDRYAAGQR